MEQWYLSEMCRTENEHSILAKLEKIITGTYKT